MRVERRYPREGTVVLLKGLSCNAPEYSRLAWVVDETWMISSRLSQKMSCLWFRKVWMSGFAKAFTKLHHRGDIGAGPETSTFLHVKTHDSLVQKHRPRFESSL